MKNLYSVCNHSPAQVYAMLAQKMDVQVLKFDQKLDKPTRKRVVVLCPTVSLFMANHEILNKCPDASVLVFDAAVKCEYLKPAEMLDVERRKHSYVYRFRELNVTTIRRKLEKDAKVEIKAKNVRVIPRLLKLTQGSFVAKIFNVLYRIPNSENRSSLQLKIFTMLSQNKPKELADYLEKEFKKSELIKDFVMLLREGKADTFAAALADLWASMGVKKKLRSEDAKAKVRATNYKRLSKQYDVSKFDLQFAAKYLSRILGSKEEA